MYPLAQHICNKRILFFDTETSGLDPETNVILQLSYIIVDGNTWNIVKEDNFYFPYPEEEWRVTQKSIEVNHITREFLSTKKLTTYKEALTLFFADLYTCQLAVAHNANFDFKYIEATAIKEKVQRHTWPTICCTMTETVDLCKIPFYNGARGYKWPKLKELAEFLNVGFNANELHDSYADVQLTLKCFKQLHTENRLPYYVYENYENFLTPIANANMLFPHQEFLEYIGVDAPHLFIHDEILATYSFWGKRVAYSISEKEVKKMHVRAILQEMGGYSTSVFIDESYVMADALIISKEMNPENEYILQQASDYQRMHPEFPIFTVEAFLRRPEVYEYEEEKKRRVLKAKETRKLNKELIENMRRNYMVDEQDRTGKNDEVICGKYYRNGNLFESCDNPVIRSKEEARLITTPIEMKIFFEGFLKGCLKVGDYVKIRVSSDSKNGLIVLRKGGVFWTGENKYIRRFLSVGKDKVARVIKVGDAFGNRDEWDVDERWDACFCDKWDADDDVSDAYATLMLYSWHDFEEWRS